MSRPRTFLELVGAPTHPSPLDRAALVLIDIQDEYVDGALPLAGVHEAAGQAARLLDLARANGVPVFHIVHHGPAGGPVFDPDGPFIGIMPAVAPLPGEPVVLKHHANAFLETALDALIRQTGRDELIIAGNMTHVCVSATTRSAAERHGYRVTVVGDATATRDLPDPQGGGIVPARVVHQAALTELADAFAVVVKDAGAWS